MLVGVVSLTSHRDEFLILWHLHLDLQEQHAEKGEREGGREGVVKKMEATAEKEYMYMLLIHPEYISMYTCTSTCTCTCTYTGSELYMCMIKSMRPIQYKTRQHNNTT